jgi:hypothetical protein
MVIDATRCNSCYLDALPDEMCENESERHEWRVDVLEFLREHLDASEATERLAKQGDISLAACGYVGSEPEGD